MHRRFRRFTTISLVVLLAVPAFGRLTRGETEDDTGPGASIAPPIERATTEVVVIEVYVTDNDGSPIRDLVMSDFVLKVDRYRRPIASLEYVQFLQAGVEDVLRQPSSPDEPPEAIAPLHPRRFILFFDDSFSTFQNQTMARRAAETFIESRLIPSDEVSLVAYDNKRHMHMMHAFTTDREVLLEVLAASIDDSIRFSDYRSEQAMRQEEIVNELANTSRRSKFSLGGGSWATATSASILARSYTKEDVAKMRPMMLALQTLVESLSAWPGYRGIVYIGDGVPEFPANDYFSLGSGAEGFNLSMEVKALARSAAARGVTMHSIMTDGLASTTDAATPGFVGLRAPNRDEAFERENSLKTLALNTGGIASTSNDALLGFEKIENQSRSYYVLTYIPEGSPDGKYHTLNVKVRRGRTRVRHRDGFVRLLPEDAYRQSVQAAYLLPEYHQELGLEINAIPGPSSAASRETDIVFYVPAGRVLFVRERGRPTARLEVGFLALDEGGEELYSLTRSILITLPLNTGADEDPVALNLVSRVSLPRKTETVSAVITDLQADAIGAARIDLPDTRPFDQSLPGLSLYALKQTSLWIEVDGSDSKRNENGVMQATFEEGPALTTRFSPGEPVSCGFRLPAGGGTDDRELNLMILRDGKVVRSKSVQSTGGPGEVVKFALPVEGLANGSYTLSVRERIGEVSRERGSLPFEISSDGRDG